MAIIKNIIDLFNPTKESKSLEDLSLKTKLKILRAVSILVFLTSLTAIIFRIFVHNTPLYNILTLVVLDFVLLCFAIYFAWAKKINWVANAFIIFYFLAGTLRVIQGGGVFSATAILYVLFCFFGFTLYGNKVGKLFILISLLSIGGIYLAQLLFPHSIPTPDLSIKAQGIFLLLAFLYNTLPMVYIFQEQDALSKKLRKFEKKQSSTVIMRRIAHEIGNSLNIAMGEILLAEEEHTVPNYKSIHHQLSKIDDLVKGLSKKASEGKLVDFLQEHEKEIHILRKNN